MVTRSDPIAFHNIGKSKYTRSDLPGFVFTYSNHDLWAATGYYTTRVTNSNPNWKARLALGQDVSSPYKLIRCVARPALASGTNVGFVNTARFETSGFNVTCEGSLLNYILATTDDVALRDQALARLKRRLSSTAGQFNALVPLAELGELRGTLRSLTGSATELVQALINIRKTKGRSAFKFAADKWLTWSFGISPTLNDIQNLCAAIDASLASPKRTRISGTANKKWVSSWNPGETTGMYLANLTRSYVYEHKLSYRYVGGFDINVKSGNNYGAGSQFSLEFGAIIPTFWELVPYSWLIDYFTTMGPFLDDVFISPAGLTKYLVLDKRYSAAVRIDSRYIQRATHGYLNQYSKPGFVDYTFFERSVLSALPHRSLRLKTVDEIGANAVNRLLNLTSLLVKR